LTPSWAAEGQRLRQFKKDQNAKLAPGAKLPADAADFAYQSLPIDITQNGTYTLYFGPVDASFDWPNSPTGVSFSFPSDSHFIILPGAGGTGEVGMVTVNGQRYLKVVTSISDFTAPYYQFTGWIY
jgi:hypothetical protein